MRTKLFARRARGRLTALIVLALIGGALFAQSAFAQVPQGQTSAPSQVQNLDGAGQLATLSKALSYKSYASVASLQRNLDARGISPGPIDGIYGPLTQQAVRTYQRQNGLTVDGKAGIQTFSQLFYGGAQGVSQLQSGLASQGFDPGPTDGLYGPKTQKAVTDFQQKGGLKVDGIAGPNTLAQLRAPALTSRAQAPVPSVGAQPPQALPRASSGVAPTPKRVGHGLSVLALIAAGIAVVVFVLGWVIFQHIERHLEAQTQQAELAVEGKNNGAAGSEALTTSLTQNGRPVPSTSRGWVSAAHGHLKRLRSEGGGS